MFTTSDLGQEFVEILEFKHFCRFWRFDSITGKGRKKEVIDSVDVSVVLPRDAFGVHIV